MTSFSSESGGPLIFPDDLMTRNDPFLFGCLAASMLQ